MPDITLSEELRFLSAQCSAQAEGVHRDQDALFLCRLPACLAILGDEEGRRLVNVSIDEAHAAHDCDLPGLVRLCGTLLNDRAARLERRARLGLGDAA